jgi:hypothetical protein
MVFDVHRFIFTLPIRFTVPPGVTFEISAAAGATVNLRKTYSSAICESFLLFYSSWNRHIFSRIMVGALIPAQWNFSHIQGSRKRLGWSRKLFLGNIRLEIASLLD